MAHPLPITLFVLYTALGAYCLAQIVILLRQKHKPFSYKIVFNGLAITWMFLRALYWALSITDLDMSQTATYFLFWLPHTILYTTFATMALFLTKVIKRREWTPKIRNRFLIWYTVFGILDVTGTIILSVVAGIGKRGPCRQLQLACVLRCHYSAVVGCVDESAGVRAGDDQFADEMDNIESCGNGVLFLGLAAVYMCVGWRGRDGGQWPRGQEGWGLGLRQSSDEDDRPLPLPPSPPCFLPPRRRRAACRLQDAGPLPAAPAVVGVQPHVHVRAPHPLHRRVGTGSGLPLPVHLEFRDLLRRRRHPSRVRDRSIGGCRPCPALPCPALRPLTRVCACVWHSALVSAHGHVR